MGNLRALFGTMGLVVGLTVMLLKSLPTDAHSLATMGAFAAAARYVCSALFRRR